jgi:hypothetical protein
MSLLIFSARCKQGEWRVSALTFLLQNGKWKREDLNALCMQEGTNILRKQYLCLKYRHPTALTH